MTMWDSTNASQIPVGVPIAAGYIDGRYAWSAADWARLASSVHVTITVLGLKGAKVCDCETGDLTPLQAASWAVGELWSGRRPTIYSNLSTWPQVVQALKAHGVTPAMVDWWAAHPTGQVHLVAGSVATQYAWNQLGQTGGLNVDWSVTNGVWPATLVPVPPPVATPVAKPVVGIAAAPHGGYWMAAADGGVFTYGPAAFHGSLGGQVLPAPITGITACGDGYYLVNSLGQVYAFNCPYFGGR